VRFPRSPSGLLSLYAMIFASVVADVAIVPLLPTLARAHGLSSMDRRPRSRWS
jgi:hypothetical protein